MFLAFLTVMLMAATGYAFLREGILTAFSMCFNVFLAGLVAFNFWEPVAEAMEPMFPKWDGSSFPPFFWGYEDAFCLMILFCVTLGLLRLATNNLASKEVEFHPLLKRSGAVAIGLVTGYLVSGFLLCVIQTLPWSEHFMGFDYEMRKREGILRVLPPDRVWLALMQRGGSYSFATSDSETDTFDPGGSFEFRYQRFRRYAVETGKPHKDKGEYGPDQVGLPPPR
jgi:hypothetical protein